jgi:SNF2 family DNA or RNA helicase
MDLWPHQRAALPILRAGHHLLLWAMGVGKTPALIIAGHQVGGRQLWITLGMLVAQAEQEMHRWRPGARVQVIRTGKDTVDPTADVVIVSYDLMRTIPVWKQLFSLRWASCVCDEGHSLAHGSATRTRAFYGARVNSPGALFLRCDRVWIATGTPVLNGPDELWSHLSRLFHHLLPAHIRTMQAFLDHFCIMKTHPYGQRVVGGKNLKELALILGQCSSRLALDDVVNLPPVRIATVPVEISAEHRRLLEAQITPEQRREIDIILTAIEGGSRAAWQRLQAMLLPLASMRRVTALAKAPAAVQLVEAELRGGADRVVIFGSHIDALRYIAERTANFGVSLLIGETPPSQREQALRDFETGRSRLLICNTSLGGFGLNLQHAHRCMFIDLPWTPAGLDQAIARLHRAGQGRSVQVSLLAVSRSIDTRVADVLSQKRHLVNEIVAGS